MKCLIFCVAACICSACNAEGGLFRIDVDLGKKPLKEVVEIAVPKGAEMASKRYFDLAEATHPDLLAHGFAVPPEQKKAVDADDMLGGLETNSVDDDAIQSFDKDVEYVVRRTKDRKSFVLMIVNRKAEDLSAEIDLKHGKMREPVYRRVFTPNGGQSWTTVAWQPPRAENLYPWTVEVPAMTVQTVTIGVR